MHWFKDEWLPKPALSYNNEGRGHFLVPNSVGLNSIPCVELSLEKVLNVS